MSVEAPEDFKGSVRAPVIDIENLIRFSEPFQHPNETAVQLGQGAFFVEQRNDDADKWRSAPRCADSMLGAGCRTAFGHGVWVSQNGREDQTTVLTRRAKVNENGPKCKEALLGVSVPYAR